MRPFREAILVAAALALSACESWDPGRDLPGPLAGTSWRLVELVSNADAAPIRPSDPWKYRLTLAADGTAAAQLDCNRAMGSWSTVAPPVDTVTFSPMAMTRAMCPEGSLDTRIARDLSQVSTFERDGDRLVLHVAGGREAQVWALATQ